MTSPSLDEEAIFKVARQVPAGAARQAYLMQACTGDEALRNRVGDLLRVDDEDQSFLAAPILGETATAALPPTDGPGTVIGPYKLLEQIGEGGFGIVFLAEQTQPVRRKVALKVLKAGMDTKQVVARFEAERQALALMDHPNIARIFDGGTTAAGRPYFVMELVKGAPITDFCDRNRLTATDRLGLFASVCQAVQHAHQKGIIHRDLKPSNVLVTMHDATPVSKVIDFGVAKALGQELTEKTLFTGFTQLVGTPMYMAPEQAGLSGLDVDTRSDVYSLGVLLYELLTGATPFDKDRLRAAGYDELRRIIREEEPAKPSTRLSTLGPVAETVSTNRGSEPRRLTALVRGELDWIVMKCLEKDRDRRYESASALAADVKRYLADEPVAACPPSAAYRLRKLWRRNRRLAATAGVIAAVLVAATAVSTWQAVKARDAQHRAEAAEQRATNEAAIATAVNEFFQNDILLQVTRAPESNEGFEGSRNITVREAVLRAAGRIDQAFPDQPLVEAAVRTTIGQALNAVGESKLAIPHLERAVSLRRLHYGDHHPETFASMGSLAKAYHLSGRIPEAVTLRRHIWEYRNAVLGPDDPATLRSLGNLASAYEGSGQLELCRQLQQQMLDGMRNTLGPTHLQTCGVQHVLAATLRKLGRVEEAVALHEQALGVWRQHNVNGSDADSFVLLTVAGTYQAAGRLDQADRLLHEKLEIDQRRGDSIGRLNRATTLGWLARTRLLQQRYSEGERFAREALTTFEQEQPDVGGRYFWMTILGSLLAGQGKSAEAESQLLQGYRGMRSCDTGVVPDRDWKLRDACERIIRFYEMTNQTDQARAWRERLAP